MVDILLVLSLLLTFVLSIWNAYASGYNIGMTRKSGTEGFQKYASYSGLGLAFVGMTYVLVTVLSYIGYFFGYVSASTVNYALSFNFIVFGIMIIGFGLMVTIQSIIIAMQRKNILSIIVSIFNVAVEIFDIYSYVEGFKSAASVLSGGSRSNETDTLLIVVIAVLIGYFITYAAYKHGLSKAMDSSSTTQNSRQGGRMGGRNYGSGGWQN
jgi:hypothetical protein